MNKILCVLNDIHANSKDIAQRTNRNRLGLDIDMLYCLLKYKASPNNYKYFEFYELNEQQRQTYVTYGVSQAMINKFNDPDYIDYFENKIKFAENFKDVYKRDYIVTDNMSYNDFLEFVNGKSQFVCKPVGGSQGSRISVYHINNNLEKIYNEIVTDYHEGFMLEQWINQHKVLSDIYPNAVNCLRIITVFDGKKTHFLTGGVTFATKTEIANALQPSLIAPVHMQSGIINKPAATFFSQLYEKHPITNAQIYGVKLPYWNEIRQMLDKASRRVEKVRYIGWDVAITPDGPVIIEGNTTPGYKYYQIPKHCENGIGNKEKYVKFLD